METRKISDREDYFRAARRVVVKVGSGVLTENSGLNLRIVGAISRQIHELIQTGREVILVSSGAMALGTKKLGFARRPDEIPRRQAVAAIGQAGLILEYEKAFAAFGKKVAQILLTDDDLSSRKRYLNARNTLNTLLEWRVLPIINENDTVAVEEIKFGDNDNLAAMITLLMDADILVNLTDIDGLYTADPRTDPQAELIPEVASITRRVETLAGGIPGALGTGGMLSKIRAARKVTAAGIPMVIARGLRPGILTGLFAGEGHGTFFRPREERLASRKCWIAFTVKPKGRIRIDQGAAEAITRKGKSLLPSGIVGVEGDFGVGAAVEFQNGHHQVLGMGLVNYSAADIRRIMGVKTDRIAAILGHKSYDEVVHRDNLVVTGELEE